MSYRPPTIEEQGLEDWMTKLGFDYDLFCLLLSFGGQTNTTIAKALSKGKPKQLDPRTVAHWRAVDAIERSK